MENELYHDGRKGMKWGQHIFCGPNCYKHGSGGKSGAERSMLAEERSKRLRKNETNRLLKLSGLREEDISTTDRMYFRHDVEHVIENRRNISVSLSSNNKEIRSMVAKEISKSYAGDLSGDIYAQQYKDRFMKNMDDYAKAVLDMAEDWNTPTPDLIKHSDELYHDGRKGMKWGQHIFCGPHCSEHGKSGKRGKKKQTVEEETPEQKKERILKSRSAKALYDNADLFTTQELNDAYSRLVLERNIKSLAPAEVSKGQQFVNKFTSTGDSVHKVFDTGSKLYNDTAKVYNTFFKGDGDPMPLIKDNDKKPENKKTNNKADDKKSDKHDNSKPDKSKTNDGEVVGEGTSGKTVKPNKPTSPETVDAEWTNVSVRDISTDNRTVAGQKYIDYLLEDEDD